jgi:V/A-type H+-transporting ATPase subunit E
MNTKLQELTEKIYQEGVEKGQTEATAIVEQAKAVAAGITAKAEEEAAAILASATEKAVELSRNTKAELQLFANQIVNALKTEIMNLVCGEVVSEAVTAAATDKDFMQQVMLTFVKNMATDEGVTIEALQAEKLTAYFKAHAKDLLNKGVTIKQVNNVKTQFVLTPENSGYKLNFGEDEFISFFKEFLRPQLVEMLFNQK